MFLMNGDEPVLWFDNDDKTIKVLNNDFLPYLLKDTIKDTDLCKSISEGIKNYDYLRTFLSDRVLLLSRDNAKAILQSISNSQKLTEEERVRLCIKCRGLSVTDNFWTKNDTEDISFDDVNLRKHHLADLFSISVLGRPVSLEHSVLAPDIDTKGMFAKTWFRKSNELFLFKTDKTTDKVNTKAEVLASDILDAADVYSHVKYVQKNREGVYGCVCKCVADDRYSLVDAEYIKSYEEMHGRDFLQIMNTQFKTPFANMAVTDYLLLNPDRHINNWGFMIDNLYNTISEFAPLYDFNQSLIPLLTHTEQTFDELIYEPTGKTMLESAKEYLPYATVDFNDAFEKIKGLDSHKAFQNLSDRDIAGLLTERWNTLQSLAYGPSPKKQ